MTEAVTADWSSPAMRAYYAGLVDGEGYIGIRTVARTSSQAPGGRRVFYVMQVTVTNSCVDPLLIGQERWGGHVRAAKGVNKPVWRWQLTSRNGADFLREIRPYLIIKREQADLALRLQKSINRLNRVALTPAELAFRADLQQQCRALNQRRYNGVYTKG